MARFEITFGKQGTIPRGTGVCVGVGSWQRESKKHNKIWQILIRLHLQWELAQRRRASDILSHSHSVRSALSVGVKEAGENLISVWTELNELFRCFDTRSWCTATIHAMQAVHTQMNRRNHHKKWVYRVSNLISASRYTEGGWVIARTRCWRFILRSLSVNDINTHESFPVSPFSLTLTVSLECAASQMRLSSV